MLWSGPRPRPIARRAHCGRAGHPPKVSGRPHWVRSPSHHHPPKQASGCPQPTAAPSGRCGQPEANPPPLVVVLIGCACGLQVPCRVPASHLLMHAHAQSGASGHASGASVAGVVAGCGSGTGVVRKGWGAIFAVFACFAGIAVFARVAGSAVTSSSVIALMCTLSMRVSASAALIVPLGTFTTRYAPPCGKLLMSLGCRMNSSTSRNEPTPLAACMPPRASQSSSICSVSFHARRLPMSRAIASAASPLVCRRTSHTFALVRTLAAN